MPGTAVSGLPDTADTNISHLFIKPSGPHNVKSLKLDPDEKHINLSWILPDEYKDTYHFFVTWQSHDWTYARNDTTDGTLYSIPELTPGTDYNIIIITKTSDGTESAIETVSNCTSMLITFHLLYSPKCMTLDLV